MSFLGKKQSEEGIIYKTSLGGFWLKVFPNRVEFKAGAGSEAIPINQIASVHLGMPGHWQIIIETTGGKKYKIASNKKKEVRDSIYQAQAMFNRTQNVSNVSVADELTKLVQLKSQGILSEQEFEVQKKKLLG